MPVNRQTLFCLAIGLTTWAVVGCNSTRSRVAERSTASQELSSSRIQGESRIAASSSEIEHSTANGEKPREQDDKIAFEKSGIPNRPSPPPLIVKAGYSDKEPVPKESDVPPPIPEDGVIKYTGPKTVVEITGDAPLYPLDLPAALHLGAENHLAIAIARNRLEAAYAEEQSASVLWLPDIVFGPNYQYHDGNIQRAIGEIIETRRNSLYIGGGPALSVNVADAIFAPLITHQFVHARTSGVDSVRNESLRDVAEAYFDLTAAFASVAIAQEIVRYAELLAEVTASFEKNELGLPSDTSRARTELQLRRQQETLSRERIRTASAVLARRLHFEPGIQLAPIDLKVVPIEIYSLDANMEGLVDLALQNRPELAEQRALIEAANCQVRQAELGPYIPSLVLSYQSGGFGGGFSGDPSGFFGKFGGREDFQAAALWDIDNLGFGNSYRVQRRRIDVDGLQLGYMQLRDRIAEEVLSSQAAVMSRKVQIGETSNAVAAARISLEQNVVRIRGGNGLPIEVLQSIQALEKAQTEHLTAVTAYNKAQFRLFAATGYSAADAAFTERPEASETVPPALDQPK